MKVVLSPKAKKQLHKLSKIDQVIIAKKIRQLSKSGGGVDGKKLKGVRNAYRTRVGDLRIVYRKYRNKIRIVLIGHRRDVYRLVERLFK